MTENVSISQSILTSLGGGSGIDIFKLARDLADVEKEPKQLAIQASIDKSGPQYLDTQQFHSNWV